MLADLFDRFFFSLVEDYLVLLEQVVALGIDGYDQRTELYTIEQFLQSGTCGAVMYSSLVKTMQGVKGIPITPLIQQEVGIVWKKGKYINGSVERFLDFMKER